VAQRRAPKPSSLSGKTWRVPDLGKVRVATASRRALEDLDRRWGAMRRPEDVHLAWRWTEIVPDMREAFIVYAEDAPIGIWASKSGSPLALEGAAYYRLDYLEIDPARRGDGATSPLLFALIAKRAAEHRASGIVLAAFNVEGLIETYVALGAELGCPRGWNHPPELVPLTFRQVALDELRALIDALQEDPGRALP